MAYSKNIDICKTHNVAVEERYIENQLQQFRQHLQKQNKRNRISEKKVHSLLIDNREIMESLETSQKHIEDFYSTPMEALQEVNNMFQKEMAKDVSVIENEIMETLAAKTENLQLENDKVAPQLMNDEEEEEAEDPVENDILSSDLKNESEDLPAMDDITSRFPEMLRFSKNDENSSKTSRRDTPSPLPDTDEVLKPLRENIEQNNGLHLRCVRFDEDVSICHIQRENSTCSNTSDGIDSVISELAEEALLELQQEEEAAARLTTILENETEMQSPHNNDVVKTDSNEEQLISVTGSSFQNTNQNEGSTLIVTGKFLRNPIPEQRKPSVVSVASTSASTLTEDTTSSSSNNEQNKIIDELFQATSQPRIAIMRRYFLKWIHFTNVEKIEREHVDGHADRVRKINIFLDKIRIEKNRMRKCQKSNQNIEEEAMGSTGGVATKKDTIENLKVNKKYQNK